MQTWLARRKGWRYSPWLPHLAVLALYAVLTAALTYPLVFSLGSGIAGPDVGDNKQHYWNLWWMRTALLDLHTNPFRTPFLFHPTGVSLYFHTLGPLPAALSVPPQYLVGLTATYNLMALGWFVLAGYAAFLLVRELTRQGAAAVVAGAIFAFSPYHFRHLEGQFNILATHWLPLYALLLLRAVRPGARWSVPLAALTLWATAMTEWYHTLFLLLFTGLVWLWEVVPARGPGARRGPTVRVALVLGLFFVCLVPLLVPMLRELRTQSYMQPEAWNYTAFSADLLALVQPQPYHPLWRDPVWHKGATVVSLGYVALGLALLALWRNRRGTGLWWLTAGAFAVLALGPVLHAGGAVVAGPGGQPLSLPFQWLLSLSPGVFGLARMPGRFDVMAILAVAVLAGYGVAYLLGRVRSWGGRVALAAGLTVAVAVEFLPAPFPVTPLQIPGPFQALAAAPGTAVLEVPVLPSGQIIDARRMVFQTVHGKAILGGYISRDMPHPWPERTAVIQNFQVGRVDADIFALDLARDGPAVLNRYGIRSILVEERWLDPPQREAVRQLAETIAGGGPARVEGETRLYLVPAAEPAALVLGLGDGWHGVEDSPRGRSRWMGESADLTLDAIRPGTYRLVATAVSYARPRRLALSLDGTELAPLEVGTAPGTVRSQPFAVGAGVTTLHLRSLDGVDVPAALGQGRDNRPLSIAFAAVRLEPEP